MTTTKKQTAFPRTSVTKWRKTDSLPITSMAKWRKTDNIPLDSDDNKKRPSALPRTLITTWRKTRGLAKGIDDNNEQTISIAKDIDDNVKQDRGACQGHWWQQRTDNQHCQGHWWQSEERQIALPRTSTHCMYCCSEIWLYYGCVFLWMWYNFENNLSRSAEVGGTLFERRSLHTTRTTTSLRQAQQTKDWWCKTSIPMSQYE